MESWKSPDVPSVPGESQELELYDTADQEVKPVEIPESGPVGMYVCGITPYDSTHLGHAATYLAFDLIYRQLLDNGYNVHYVQNVTDVDDPLFERAERDGVDWKELGQSQIDLFRSDMAALSVIPPRDFVAATETVSEAAELIERLLANGAAYTVEDMENPDIYAAHDATEQFGYESNYSGAEMEKLFAERGGDPDRPGKAARIDALLWRSEREGEPSLDTDLGPGRPGWHVECSAIALNRLGSHFSIQGGGHDLMFPHHEYSAAHVEAATGVDRMAGHYVHTGMIGLDGTKMSKSLGNLVFVSNLLKEGYDPSAIRLGVFAGHYREHRDWSDEVLADASSRLAYWREAAKNSTSMELAEELVGTIRECLANDLDTPGVIKAVDAWAIASSDSESNPEAGKLVARALDGLMGIKLDLPED